MDDVRAIVNRAVKDLKIEQSLKTYEEVWLSKVFDLKLHSRSLASVNASKVMDDGGVPTVRQLLEFLVFFPFW